MKKSALFVGTCIILAIVGVFGFGLWQNRNTTTSYASSSSAASSAGSQATYTVNQPSLDGIQSVINANTDLDISVSLTDLQTGKTYSYGDTASYDAASLIKLVTAAAYLHEVEQGDASLGDSIGGTTAQDELQLMIVDSDNDAWANMENAIGLDQQQAYAESIGLTSYQVTDNIISSSDVALLLTKLASGKLLDDNDSQLLLGYMQQANYRDYIVAAIPSGVSVYHKVGILDDRLHDAAIIKKGSRSYVLVIMSKADSGTYDYDQGAQLFGDITKDSLQAFFGIT
jgi:beta-lactamase class A